MASEHERRLTEYEAQVDQLQEMIKGLEEEVVVLRRRLQDAPKRVRTLEERLLETKGQLAQAVSQNEKLSATLREAREHIAALREEVDKLTMPPSAYGTYLGTNDDGTVDIFTAGRKMRVALHPEIEIDELKRGQEVVLNESLNVVLARSADLAGEVVTFKELLEDRTRALVIGRADEERVCELAEELLGERLRSGDHLLMEGRSGLLLEKRHVDLADVARAAADSIAPRFAEAGIAFSATVQPAWVLGDANRIEQVVTNLLSNALRYTEAGGKVTLTVARSGDEVSLDVADTGIGIRAEDLRHIFTRFWRGDPSRSRATGGTGIGLAIVRELVRAHEGRIDVDSVPGVGSRFRVILRALEP